MYSATAGNNSLQLYRTKKLLQKIHDRFFNTHQTRSLIIQFNYYQGLIKINIQVIGQWVCFPDHSASSMAAEVDSDNEEETSSQTGASGPPDTIDETNASRELSAALKALKDSPVQPMPMQAFFVANSKSNWYTSKFIESTILL